MNPLWYPVSWFLNLLLIAVLVGIADRIFNGKIEEHRALGAFFIFFLPLFLELASFLFADKPFLANMIP